MALADDAPKAANFYRFWRQRLFDDETLDIRRDGFVYVPLQSQLLRKRSFQTCSPIEMIEAVLKHDTTRQVMVTLHPEETYSAEEQNALYLEGKSKCDGYEVLSNHQSGLAVDL